MINYKLAKQLKEAGLKFQEIPEKKLTDLDGNDYFAPTLSELIESCGDELWVLRKGLFMGKRGWVVGKPSFNLEASAEEPNPFMWETHEFGETPEEAVARLWLKLNE